MIYQSTRGQAPELGFCDALLTGLARDGGLYIPKDWPVLSASQIKGFAGESYTDVAKVVLSPFTGNEIPTADFERMIEEAYATFHHPAVTPLVQYGENHWILELFHGPTLAFKDVAMQLISRLMDYVLEQRAQRATIVCATSGDTGGAAVEAFRGRANADIFVLFPNGKVSPVQQRQMTTVADGNVHTMAIEGDFDDCQALVKAMFNHHAYRDRLQLSGVNSINWGRIMAQVVYYFTAASSLGAPDRKVSFTVPSGNFGDIFAGFVAKQMGLPIDQLVIATNQNDILARTLNTGRYEVSGTTASISPSMDIQVSSNFERLLFEASGRNSETVRTQMAGLRQSGAFNIDEASLKNIRSDFAAGTCSEADTAQQITNSQETSNYLCDPHTAVGLFVAENNINAGVPMVTLSTAHPAKFPDAVEKASGIRPALPEWLSGMMERDEKFETLPNNIEEVESFIEQRSRAAKVS